ncbi:MAG: prolipoprotein diacylglyceryl transferase [Clostridia bacterium]|nr:prolipoprotein diacylglyceryl transferase [Clostridia bacterium]
MISTALFAARLKKGGKRHALLAAVCACLLGAVGAKALYFLLVLAHDWPSYGLRGLFLFDYYRFSFFGGCLGAVLGVMLYARLAGLDKLAFLDAFAPAGALMLAFARASEYFLDGVNIPGEEMENPLFQRFPFAVINEWEEWYAALFMAAAALALAVCLAGLISKKESRVPGLRMQRTVFYLCLPQVFLESLRSESIKWGFVRAEQVLCAVCMLFVLISLCRAARGMGFWKTYWPVAVDLLCVIVMVGVEFNLDKVFVDVSATVDYAVMWLALLVIAGCECYCVRRRLAKAS